VARVTLLCADLLFGSNVEGALAAAGHDVQPLESPGRARSAAADSELLVVDLTDETLEGPGLVRAMREAGELDHVPTLGFYSHVDQETRREAEEAGFDLVVPRSRMAREAAQLVHRLTGG
jgi:PleD family two-component response regulator